jgi:hypothetical protein
MPFEYILSGLLSATPNSVGALFVDDNGETVHVACSTYTPTEMKVLGAYVGLHIRRVNEYLPVEQNGELELLHIENDGLHVYASPLPEGYYLVLAQKTPGLTAVARRSLASASQALRTELFD